MTNRNDELRLELLRRYGTQTDAAVRLGVDRSRLSLIVNRHVRPIVSEYEKLVKGLGVETTLKLLGPKPTAEKAARKERATA